MKTSDQSVLLCLSSRYVGVYVNSKRDKDLLKLIFLRTLKNRSWQWSSRASETGDGFNVVSTNVWQCHQIQLIQHKVGTNITLISLFA